MDVGGRRRGGRQSDLAPRRLPGHAADGQRRALHGDLARPGGGAGSGHWQSRGGCSTPAAGRRGGPATSASCIAAWPTGPTAAASGCCSAPATRICWPSTPRPAALDPAFGEDGRVDLMAGVARATRGTHVLQLVGADRRRRRRGGGRQRARRSDRPRNGRAATSPASTSAPASACGPSTRFREKGELRPRHLERRRGGVHRQHQRVDDDVGRRGARPASTCRSARRPTTSTAATARATTCSPSRSWRVDARTGERKWHFQAVHHGVWDYDLPARADAGRHHGRRPAGSRRWRR